MSFMKCEARCLCVHQWTPSLAALSHRNTLFILSLQFLWRQPSCPSTLLRQAWQSFALWQFTFQRHSALNKPLRGRTCFFFLFSTESAPVLKSNHAHDFNVSSKEKERRRGTGLSLCCRTGSFLLIIRQKHTVYIYIYVYMYYPLVYRGA